MKRIDRPALSGTALGWLLRLWNPFMKRLLKSPLHQPWSRWFLIIEWTGRKTGRVYRTPVSYLRHDQALLITTGDIWWKNLVGGAPVRVWVGGRARRATADVIATEDDAVALHQRMFSKRPFFAALAGIDRREPGQIVRSVRGGRRMVRVRIERHVRG